MKQLHLVPDRIGGYLGVLWGVALSVGRADDQQVLRVPSHAARELTALANHCFPVGLILGLLLGRLLDRFAPELQAPGRLTELALAPVALLITGMLLVLLRGITEAEHYAVNIDEGGFRFIRDCGGNLATDVIAPRILAAAIGGGLLAAAIVAATYIGAAPLAVLGLTSHPVITGGGLAVSLRAGVYGTAFGIFVALSAFLVGLETRNPSPGLVSRRLLGATLPVLIVVILVIVWQ